MLIKLILAAVLIFILFRVIHYVKRLPKKRQRDVIFKGTIGFLIAAILIGVATGKMHWLGAIAAALIPIARFGYGAAMRALPIWLQRNGGTASFKTEYLDVKIYVQQGYITGKVLKGKHEGKSLENLDDEALQELEEAYRNVDTKSYWLIRFARQRKGKSQQQQSFQHESPQNPFSDPERDEALKILGLEGEPSREEIVAAHRRLINKLHPDRGGSDFLAARVNQAKDILLKNRK